MENGGFHRVITRDGGCYVFMRTCIRFFTRLGQKFLGKNKPIKIAALIIIIRTTLSKSRTPYLSMVALLTPKARLDVSNPRTFSQSGTLFFTTDTSIGTRQLNESDAFESRT